jgi:hypothetical protein
LCSDIGPLLLAKSGATLSDVPKPCALCLKTDLAAVSNFIDYRFRMPLFVELKALLERVFSG